MILRHQISCIWWCTSPIHSGVLIFITLGFYLHLEHLHSFWKRFYGLTQRAKTDFNKKSGTKQKTIKTLLYKPQGFKWTINENPPTREIFWDQILVSWPGIEPGTSGLQVKRTTNWANGKKGFRAKKLGILNSKIVPGSIPGRETTIWSQKLYRVGGFSFIVHLNPWG